MPIMMALWRAESEGLRDDGSQHHIPSHPESGSPSPSTPLSTPTTKEDPPGTTSQAAVTPCSREYTAEQGREKQDAATTTNRQPTSPQGPAPTLEENTGREVGSSPRTSHISQDEYTVMSPTASAGGLPWIPSCTACNHRRYAIRSEDKVTVHFINRDGEKITTEGKIGDSLLDVVVNKNLDIDGFGACVERRAPKCVRRASMRQAPTRRVPRVRASSTEASSTERRSVEHRAPSPKCRSTKHQAQKRCTKRRSAAPSAEALTPKAPKRSSGAGEGHSGSGAGEGHSGSGAGEGHSGSGAGERYSGSGVGEGHSGSGAGEGHFGSGAGEGHSGSGAGEGHSGSGTGSSLDAGPSNFVDGACEGTLACSTCHLIFDENIFKQLDPVTDEEMDMLDLAYGLTETSRLGCQICLSKSMNGMTVSVPEGVADVRQAADMGSSPS
ncbi:Adrenodoxin, mitochondrial [Acipenser ruthenus]|uniref:Adrenodoxin, mitochondrial n=1 Tax=Acipenser ruthenus TaxID=7906 RepID=A0A444UI29_ACIRT|nr:Adrenodoxin, mitochondrial [Acipenser ruthenus]